MIEIDHPFARTDCYKHGFLVARVSETLDFRRPRVADKIKSLEKGVEFIDKILDMHNFVVNGYPIDNSAEKSKLSLYFSKRIRPELETEDVFPYLQEVKEHLLSVIANSLEADEKHYSESRKFFKICASQMYSDLSNRNTLPEGDWKAS